jgi:hypothetical protein
MAGEVHPMTIRMLCSDRWEEWKQQPKQRAVTRMRLTNSSVSFIPNWNKWKNLLHVTQRMNNISKPERISSMSLPWQRISSMSKIMTSSCLGLVLVAVVEGQGEEGAEEAVRIYKLVIV